MWKIKQWNNEEYMSQRTSSWSWDKQKFLKLDTKILTLKGIFGFDYVKNFLNLGLSKDIKRLTMQTTNLGKML